MTKHLAWLGLHKVASRSISFSTDVLYVKAIKCVVVKFHPDASMLSLTVVCLSLKSKYKQENALIVSLVSRNLSD